MQPAEHKPAAMGEFCSLSKQTRPKGTPPEPKSLLAEPAPGVKSLLLGQPQTLNPPLTALAASPSKKKKKKPPPVHETPRGTWMRWAELSHPSSDAGVVLLPDTAGFSPAPLAISMGDWGEPRGIPDWECTGRSSALHGFCTLQAGCKQAPAPQGSAACLLGFLPFSSSIVFSPSSPAPFSPRLWL